MIAIENTRLLKELRERTDDLSELLEQSGGMSAQILAQMNLYDGESFRNVALYNVPPAYAASQTHILIQPHPQSGLATVARTHQVVHIEDIRTQPPYLEGNPSVVAMADLAGARTIVVVPMLRENELIGTIVIYRQEVSRFTDKQIDLLTNFAKQAVIAIENTRLLKELRLRTDDLSESLEQQTATSEVLEIISGSPGELDPVFEKMLENATRICGANFGQMNFYDEGSFRPVALYNMPPAYAASPALTLFQPHPQSGLGTVARTHQVIHIEDIRTLPPYLEGNPSVVALADLAGARTYFVVPMLKENELIGAITIFRQEVKPFTEKQTELVANFAKQAVIAIENTRLLKELRERTDDLSESLATTDRNRRCPKSHQPLGVRPEIRAHHAGRVRKVAVWRVVRRDLPARRRRAAASGGIGCFARSDRLSRESSDPEEPRDFYRPRLHGRQGCAFAGCAGRSRI